MSAVTVPVSSIVRRLFTTVLGIEPDHVQPDTDLQRDLGFDKLLMVELLDAIDMLFDVDCLAGEPGDRPIVTVTDLCAVVERAVTAKAPA